MLKKSKDDMSGNQSDQKNKSKKRLKRAIIHFIMKMAFVALAGYGILTYVLGFYRMGDNNMFPNIKDGDLCILYKLEDYHSNEIVLYHSPDGNIRLGRIVAIEGQQVDFPDEGGYTVNGYQPSEEITYETNNAEKTNIQFPLDIEEGKVFILNDFRSLTEDSREYGSIDKSDICGKLIFILRRRGF